MDLASSAACSAKARRVAWTWTLAIAVTVAAGTALGQDFRALDFADDIWTATVERLLAIGIVALFLERAIEVYIVGSRRQGEAYLVASIEAYAAEAKKRAPGDDAPEPNGLVDLRWRLTAYKLQSQRIAFLIAIAGGTLIAATGLRVLDGLITISPALRSAPTWHTKVWWSLDIVLSGAVIAGGAHGVHRLVDAISAAGMRSGLGGAEGSVRAPSPAAGPGLTG